MNAPRRSVDPDGLDGIFRHLSQMAPVATQPVFLLPAPPAEGERASPKRPDALFVAPVVVLLHDPVPPEGFDDAPAVPPVLVPLHAPEAFDDAPTRVQVRPAPEATPGAAAPGGPALADVLRIPEPTATARRAEGPAHASQPADAPRTEVPSRQRRALPALLVGGALLAAVVLIGVVGTFVWRQQAEPIARPVASASPAASPKTPTAPVALPVAPSAASLPVASPKTPTAPVALPVAPSAASLPVSASRAVSSALPVAASPVAASLTPASVGPSQSWTVHFARNSVTPLESRPPDWLRACSHAVIVGHTDASGVRDANERIGLGRAIAARRLLGDDTERSGDTVRSAGSSEPVGDNALPAGRQANRRSVITCP